MSARRGPLRGPALLACLTLALAPACRGCGGEAGREAAISSDLRIPVLIDGVEGAPVDAALLERTQPDFVDGERRAWRLRSLLGAAAGRPGAVIEVEDEAGLRAVVSGGSEPADGREPVLAFNRTGGVGLALIHPEEPFPSFHGRGGTRGRSGDPSRIREVRRIWIHADPGAGAVAPPRGPDPAPGAPTTTPK